MKEKFYYLKRVGEWREGGGLGIHRCGIVYLLLGENKAARGISLCSEEDPFMRDEGFLPNKNEKTFTKFIGGLELARKRAVKAFMSGKSSEPILRDEAIQKVPDEMKFKSEFNPLFYEYEMHILAGKREVVNNG